MSVTMTLSQLEKIFFLQAMLSGPGQYRENEANEIRFKEIPSHVLSKICQYFMYRVSQSTSYF